MFAIPMGQGWGIPIGLPVVTADGCRLGIVTTARSSGLLVGDCHAAPHTYALELADVARYADGALHLTMTTAEVTAGRRVGCS